MRKFSVVAFAALVLVACNRAPPVPPNPPVPATADPISTKIKLVSDKQEFDPGFGWGLNATIDPLTDSKVGVADRTLLSEDGNFQAHIQMMCSDGKDFSLVISFFDKNGSAADLKSDLSNLDRGVFPVVHYQIRVGSSHVRDVAPSENGLKYDNQINVDPEMIKDLPTERKFIIRPVLDDGNPTFIVPYGENGSYTKTVLNYCSTWFDVKG